MNQLIKVLHSELQDSIGGIESFLYNLLQCVDRNQVQFDFLMRGENEQFEKKLTDLGANIYKVPSNYIEYITKVKRILREQDYDIVHIHKNSAANIILPKIVKSTSKAKLIVHSHNTSPSSGSKLLLLLHKMNRNKLYNLADYYFACSDLAAEWMFGKEYKYKNVKIVKNGIIVQNFAYNPNIRIAMRKKMGIENDFVIGHVGAFRKQKNQEYLLEILSKLPLKNTKLFFVGQGDFLEYVKEKSTKYHEDDRVRFLGSRSDISNLLQAFDVFVMPSLWEGLSVAAIEAQASGLPVLLSDKVSKKSKITKNVSFYSLDNLDSWIKAIIDIDKNFVRRDVIKEIREAGYDMQDTATMITDFYKKIC